MKNIKKNFIKFILFSVVFCSLFTATVFYTKTAANAEQQIEIVEKEQSADTQKLSQSFVNGTLVNNLICVNFAGEDDINDMNMYDNSYTLFNEMYNGETNSVQEYYKINSNGHLELVTEIMSKDKQNVVVVTIDKPRTYFMPYVVRKNGSYIVNPNGYFEYAIFDANVTSYYAYFPSFIQKAKLISNVYKAPTSSWQKDSNNSDKIMTYDEAKIFADRNTNYHLIESGQAEFREYELICMIMEQAIKLGINVENSDKDNNNKIDLFSIALLDDRETASYYVGWSDLLWPHKVSFSYMENNFKGCFKSDADINKYITYFCNNGYKQSDAERIVKYIANRPNSNGITFDTINMANYEVYNLNTQYSYEKVQKDISTACHELGHMLGLPDLYIYSTNSSIAVGSWSHMCQNPNKNSYFTSYEREKLGWLDSNNIIEITNKGVYTLSAVVGMDNQNVVAYKIKDPVESNKYVYFEYRNCNLGTYDSQAGRSGLLIYSVDKSINGNSTAPPYEIYIQRADNKSTNYATLQLNESLGDLNKKNMLNTIKHGIGTDNVRNTGIVAQVTSINDYSLTFKVDSNDLLQEFRRYTVDDFDGNEQLYNKLVGLTKDGNINYNSLNSFETLTLNNCKIDNLDFLKLFDLSNLKNLILTNNLLTENVNLQNIISTYSLTKIDLNGNNINLNKISQQLLENPIVTWGVQFKQQSKVFVNKNIVFDYYLKSSDDVDITIDDMLLQKNSTIQNYTISENGSHTLKMEYKNNSSNTQSIQLIKINASTIYTQDNPYLILIGENFPDCAELVDVEGSSEIQFSYNPVSTQTASKGAIKVNLLYNGEKVGEVDVYYLIYSKPVVHFNHIGYLAQFEPYVEKGITVYEDGVQVDYTYDTLVRPNTYYTQYYKGTLSADGQPNLQVQVNSIDTSIKTTYVIIYIITNSYSKTFTYYMQLTISSPILDPTEVDSNIYSKLLQIKDNDDQIIFLDDFKNYDYLDLSNIDAKSLKGLSKLEFDQNIVINLNNNELSDIYEVNTLLNNRNITLHLLFNNFNTSQLNLLSTKRQNAIFGIQNAKSVNFILQQEDFMYIADIVNDFEGTYTLTNNNNFSIQSGKLHVTSFGVLNIVFTDNLNKQFIKRVENIGIIAKNSLIIKEYSDIFNYSFIDLYQVYGTNESLATSSNINELTLQVIGSYNLQTNVSFHNYSTTLNQQIRVVDTQAPVFSYTGNNIVYATSVEEYQSFEFSISAYDDYDGAVDIVENIPNIITYGNYTITYIARDLSGNSKTFERFIYIGYVNLTQNSGEQGYNIYFQLPFNFFVFNKDDFNISYKRENESLYKNYDINTGIKFEVYDNFNIDVKLVHKYNQNIVYDFQYNVNIIDNVKPEIQLVGDKTLTLYAGGIYQELGYLVTDNSVKNQTLTLNNNVEGLTIDFEYYFMSNDGSYVKEDYIDLTKVGSHLITYIAKDKSNNTSSTQRNIQVVYYPVNNIQINEDILLLKYSEGKNVTFYLTTQSPYIIDPNITIIWYVNGEEYTKQTGLKTTIYFEQEGDYIVSASVFGNEQISTQQITITIYKNSPLEIYAVIVFGSIAGIVVIGFVIFFIKKYLKRNFY